MSERNKKRLELIKREKRNLYLLVAVRIFQQKGFHATTIKDITDAAGTSVGNIYQYFKNKEQIFLVLAEALHKVMLGKLQELNQYEIPPPLEVIKQIFKDIVNSLKEQKAIALIFIEEMCGISKEFQELHNRLYEAYISELEKIFSRGFQLLNITGLNPRITAIGWISTFLQAFSWWARTDFEMKLEDFTNGVVNFLLFGTVATRQDYPPS